MRRVRQERVGGSRLGDVIRKIVMSNEVQDHFRAFELFSEEHLMRGFLRVGRLELADAEEIMKSREFGFAQPFDVQFGKMMVKAMAHILGVFDSVLFGLAHSYEFSVVLTGQEAENEDSALARDLGARLGGEASGKLATLLGCPVSFETRLYEFPSAELVRRYFEWRRAVNRIRVLDRYVEYVLVGSGSNEERISEIVTTFGTEEKLEILGQNDVHFASVPGWQRFGVAAYWQAGVDESAPRLLVDTELPEDEDFHHYLAQRI